MMPTEYMVPTQWIQDEPNDDIEAAIWVRMDDLVHFDEKCQQAEENMNHIQLLKKINKMTETKREVFKKAN